MPCHRMIAIMNSQIKFGFRSDQRATERKIDIQQDQWRDGRNTVIIGIAANALPPDDCDYEFTNQIRVQIGSTRDRTEDQHPTRSMARWQKYGDYWHCCQCPATG